MFSDFFKGFIDGSSYKKIAPYIVGIVAVFLLFLFVRDCRGQLLNDRVSTSAGMEVSAWAYSSNQYQNNLGGSGSAVVHFGSVKLHGGTSLRWWGASDGKAEGSFLNAETGRVLGRTRKFSVRYHHKNFSGGPAIYRNQIHHFWRNSTGRYNGFPPSNDWRTAVRQCTQKISPPRKDGYCPSIGYYEKVGVVLSYNPSWAEFEVRYLPYQFKDLTLPPVVALASAKVKPGITKDRLWRFTGEFEYDETNAFYYDFGVRRKITDYLWVGVEGGEIGAPAWTGSIQRVSANVSLRY